MTDRFDDGPTDPHRTLDPDARQHLHRELTGDDLVAAVYANPDDDEPRLVYGDYLLERDDPRGEFVQLQLARSRGEPASAREAELLARHVEAWTAPLYAALHPSSIVFERGFLAGCGVQNRTIALRDVVGHPMWLTVEQLVSDDESLLAHPCLRSLRWLSTTPRGLARLAAVGREVPLESARLTGYVWSDEMSPEWLAVREVGALANLRSVALVGDRRPDEQRTTALLASRLGNQLHALELILDRAATLAGWETVVRDHRSIRRVAIRGCKTFYPVSLDGGLAVLARDEHGNVAARLEVEARFPSQWTFEALRGLPPSFRRLEVTSARRPITKNILEGVHRLVGQRFAEIVAV